MTVWCHYVAFTLDPGYVTPKNLHSISAIGFKDPENLNLLFCKKCNVPKVDHVHHCSVCNKCVYKMDHHCPWINNCVALNTLKPFMLFNLYLSCLCAYGGLIVIINIYEQYSVSKPEDEYNPFAFFMFKNPIIYLKNVNSNKILYD